MELSFIYECFRTSNKWPTGWVNKIGLPLLHKYVVEGGGNFTDPSCTDFKNGFTVCGESLPEKF